MCFGLIITILVYSTPGRRQGQGLRRRFTSLRDPLTAFLVVLSECFVMMKTEKMVWVERSESVEVPLPSTAEGFLSSPQTYQGFSTPPPLKVKGSGPTMSKGVCGLLTQESDSQVISPSLYYLKLSQESRFRQSMSSPFWTNLRARGKSEEKRG